MQLPQSMSMALSMLSYPVLAAAFGSGKIHGRAILIMFGQTSIKAIQIGLRNVNVVIVTILQRTTVRVIQEVGLVGQLELGLHTDGNIQRTKTIIFGKSAK